MDRRPSLALTFGNLGEVRRPRSGRPPLCAHGGHRSVAVALPRLLERLAELELTATFCVEATDR